MNRFAFALYFPFIAVLLFAGCAASTYFMNTPEPSPEKEIRQTLELWKGTHISQAIQKWGSPHEVTGAPVGPKTYIWQTLSSGNAVYEFIFHTRSNGVIHKTDTRRYKNLIHESNWKEKHISKVIQEWGTPHGVIDDGTVSKIYIWQMPVLELLPREYYRIGSRLQTNGFHSVSIAGASVPTSDTHELIFYTRPDGVIYKTLTKKELNTSAGSRLHRVSQEKQGSTK